MAKTKRKAQKALCDRLFSRKVRARGNCQRCGTTERLQCAHIISRRYVQIRWDDDNALCLCVGCHHWAHMNPLEFEEFVVHKIGDDLYCELKTRARATGHVDYADVLATLGDEDAA